EQADHWFLATTGLALIPPRIVPETWTSTMDQNTPDNLSVVEFTDYLIRTYVDSDCSLFDTEIWNVNNVIPNDLDIRYLI
ncbi:unnamed protein product, partial [Didymodactylos carnosus]